MSDAQAQFFSEAQAPDHHVALLVAQVGAMPTELQLIVQTVHYDEGAGGLRPIHSYIIRVLGALEHRISNLGTTSADVQFVSEHPLLVQYRDVAAALFFRGQTEHADALALEIAQAHADCLGAWRPFPQYLNVAQPLATLLGSGGGLVGQMPLTLAEALAPALERRGLETKILTEQQPYHSDHAVMQNQNVRALLIGTSYFISFAFSFEQLQGR